MIGYISCFDIPLNIILFKQYNIMLIDLIWIMVESLYFTAFYNTTDYCFATLETKIKKV